MNKELQDLKERISSLSDEELLKMVHVDSADYREEAISFAKEELKQRNLEKVSEDKIKELEVSEDKIKELNKSFVDKNRKKKGGFSLFSTKPNSIRYGGGILMFLGGFNAIVGFWGFLGGTAINFYAGLLLLGLGIGALGHYSFCIYIGTII